MVYQPAKYISLKSQFEDMKERLAQGLEQGSIKKLLAFHTQVQDFFQTQILDAAGRNYNDDEQSERREASEMESEISEELVVAHYVEVNKQMRLLGADLTMLHAARNPDTIAKRQQQASDRLGMLISYCNALLQIDAQS
jgi:hypothetical protein